MQDGSGHRLVAEPALHIAHVSADFPDAIAPDKTPVIRRLIELAPPPLDHQVFSLNRVSPSLPALAKATSLGGGRPKIAVDAREASFGHAVRYHAPGKGLFHVHALCELGAWLAGQYAENAAPDLLVGHKLSVEGIAVHHAAKRLGIPYAITIQGNTDLKILTHRSDLRGAIGEAFHGAAHVFSFAPWSLAEVERLLGERKGPSEVLPCPPDFSDMLAPDPAGEGLLCVFHLHNYKGKNLARMAAAMRQLGRDYRDCTLTVVGGGSDADIARCRRLVSQQENVILAGAMERAAVRQAMNRAAGLVLPSLRESFGLVFIEALLSGLPIVYPKGAAVDGYFDGCDFAIAVDARSEAEIAAAMVRLLRDSAALKEDLRAWQQSAAAQRFLPENIGQQFCAGLRAAASRPAQ